MRLFKYGNITLVSNTVSSNFSGLDAKPVAKRKTSWGLKIIPNPLSMVVAARMRVKVFAANFLADSRSLCSRISV